MKSMASRADGHDRGTMAVRSERYVVRSRADGHRRREGCGAQRDGYEGGCGVGELRLCGTPY